MKINQQAIVTKISICAIVLQAIILLGSISIIVLMIMLRIVGYE